MAEVPPILVANWASYQVFLKNGTEATEERNPIFHQRVQNVKMKFNLPRMDPEKEYHFKDIIGRNANDFSEKPGGLRGADLDIAKETKACVLATFMCIVVDEQFQRAEDEDKRIYHWNGVGATEEESSLKDRKLWEMYHWQSKLKNGELKDLPQHKDLKDYILKIFVKSSGKLD